MKKAGLSSVLKVTLVAFAGAFISLGCGVAGLGNQEEAACIAPQTTLEADPETVAPDSTFTLKGDGFFGDYVCNDTDPPEQSGKSSGGLPADDIKIELIQGENTRELATVSSNDNLAFEKTLNVPSNVQPGQAILRARVSTVDTPGVTRASAKTPLIVSNDPSTDEQAEHTVK